MTIDLLSESEIPAALRLSTQAGWNHVDVDLRRLLTLWPHGFFAGRVGGEVVATTTLAVHGAHVGWVGLVLVDEAHRRQGLGAQMLDAMLVAAQEMGVKTLGLDATDLGRPLYLARGFRDVRVIDRLIYTPHNSGKNTNSPRPAVNSDDPRTDAAAWKEILAMDLRAARLDRSVLLNHFRNEPAIVCRSVRQSPAGPLQAFGMLRPGRMGSHIAPVIAESESAAQAVIDQLLSGALDTLPIFIDVESGRLKSWLTDRGFTPARSVVRMQAGIRGPQLLGPKIFAGCGFELG